MAIHVEEKLALARELHLDQQQWLLEAKQEAESLTDLPFQPITDTEIEVLLLRNLRRTLGFWSLFVTWVSQRESVLILTGLETLLGAIVLKATLSVPWVWCLGGSFLVCTAIAFCCGSFVFNLVVRSCPLSSWEHELPYGALCAVKEATAHGLSDFCIHYPVLLQRDPVITGTRASGVRRLVFAWDEGLLYREAQDL